MSNDVSGGKVPVWKVLKELLKVPKLKLMNGQHCSKLAPEQKKIFATA